MSVNDVHAFFVIVYAYAEATVQLVSTEYAENPKESRQN